MTNRKVLVRGSNGLPEQIQTGDTPADGDGNPLASGGGLTQGQADLLYDAIGAAAAAQAASQPLDPQLTALASITVDTDGTLAANSDTVLATQKAVKTYADQLIAAADAMIFKGVIDCSGNPNYPAADRGHTYRVSVAGKIGGASGTNVEAGDLLICLTDGTIAGTQAGVGASWTISQTNLDGAVIGPASATDSHFAQFDGVTGKLIKGGKVAPSGVVVGTTDTQTFTNKRNTLRIQTLTDAATVTPNSDDYDGGILTSLSQTTLIDNPTGTPTDQQKYVIRIKSASAQTLNFGTNIRSGTDVILPTATPGSALTLYVGIAYNLAATKWDCIAKATGY